MDPAHQTLDQSYGGKQNLVPEIANCHLEVLLSAKLAIKTIRSVWDDPQHLKTLHKVRPLIIYQYLHPSYHSYLPEINSGRDSLEHP